MDDGLATTRAAGERLPRPRRRVPRASRDGLICEVRAYYHERERRPARASTTPAAGTRRCEPRGDRSKGVRAAAARRPIPPFTEEHEELRESIRRFVAERAAPARAASGRTRAGSPTRSSTSWPRIGFLGPEVPGGVRRRGRRLPARRGASPRSCRAAARAALAAGHRRAHRHRHAADLEVRHRGPEAALPRARDPRREDRRARDHRARRRLRRRRRSRTRAEQVDGGYVVNGSKTFITNGVRADFVVTAVKTTREGGHHGLSFLIVEREHGGLRRLDEAREDGLARLRHRPSSPSTTCSSPRRTCSARRTRAST